MSKVLDEFYLDLQCPICKLKTEHRVQKIDEDGNGEHIGYYSNCDVCDFVTEVEEEIVTS